MAEPHVRARSRLSTLALLLLSTACADGSLPTAPESSTLSASGNVRYVDAVTGSDSADGLTPGTSYRSISRALADVPTLVDAPWTLHLAPGTYEETVRLHRFSMPAALSYEQVLGSLDSVPSIALRGDPADPAAVSLEAPAGQPCLSAAGAVVFVAGVTCRSSDLDGVLAAGSTLVLDEVRVLAADSARAGISVDRSSLFMGGTIRVEGPFAQGLSIRSNSVARNQTHDNPLRTVIDVSGAEQGIFLRDQGTLSLFGGSDTVRIAQADVGVHAIFNSTAFFSVRVLVQVSDVRAAYWSAHQSGINSHATHFTNVRSALFRCSKQSYAIVETPVYVNANRSYDTDGTCVLKS